MPFIKPNSLSVLALAFAMIFLFAFACADDDDDNDDAQPDVNDDDVNDDADDDVNDDVDDDLDDDVDDDIDDDVDDDSGPEPICVQGVFEPYWGVLHAHTSYSDGQLTPADAFAHARDVAGLDIMIVTDHLEQLYFPFPSERYEKCLEESDDAYDPGFFLTDCGFEYGSGFRLPLFQSTGHNNVFNSFYLFPIVQLDFHDFYDDLVRCVDCVGQFNHPVSDPLQHWNHFEYFPVVDVKMNLFEFNGGGLVWEAFFEALDAGWHVSPMYNQDNHSPDWGTKDDRRSGFFLADLTREDLYGAMMERRSFMSYDKNASISMIADENCWMGSILEGYASLPLDIEVMDIDDGDGFVSIELFGPEIELLGTVDCAGEVICTANFDPQVDGPTYFVARATQTDGEWLVSAPIWVAPGGAK